MWTYQASLQAEITSNNDERLAERLASIMRTVMRVPAPDRELTAHALAGGPFDIHWSLSEHAVPGGPGVERLRGMRRRLLAIAPELHAGNLVIGTTAKLRDDEHIAMISMQLPDQSWVNVSAVSVRVLPLSSDGTLYSTSLMAGGLLLIAVLLLSWLTRPLKVFADAARQFSTGAEVVKVAESGPTEVKQLAAAFNEMQVRIKKLRLRRLITRAIAIIPAAIVTIWYGESGTARLLILTQVVLSLQLSFAVFPLVMFTANRAKMGELVAPRWLTTFAGFIAVVIAVLNVKLLIDFVFG